jgi:CHAT domain-containing protein/WD40 repeat protein
MRTDFQNPHLERVSSLDFDPRGNHIMSGSWFGGLASTNIVTESFTGRPTLRLERDWTIHPSVRAVTAVKFDRSGKLFAAAGQSIHILILDSSSGKVVQTLESPLSTVWCVDFSPNGKYFAAAAENGDLAIWNLVTESMVGKITLATAARAISFDQDSESIVCITAGANLLQFDCEPLELLNEKRLADSPIRACDISPVDMRIGFSTVSGQIITTFVEDVLSQATTPTILGLHAGRVWAVSMSKDGETMVTGSDDHSVKMWDTTTATLVRQSRFSFSGTWTLKVSPKGKYVVLGGQDGSVRIWEPNALTMIHPLVTNSAAVVLSHGNGDSKMPVRDLTIGPEGEYLYSVGDDQQLRILDVRTEQLLNPVHFQTALNAVEVSVDNSLVFVGGNDGHIYSSATPKGITQHYLTSQKTPGIPLASITLDQFGLMATGHANGNVTLHNPISGAISRQFYMHEGAVYATLYLKKRHLIVTAGADKLVKIWSPIDGQIKAIISSHKRAVQSLLVNTDESTLYSSAVDGTTLVSLIPDNLGGPPISAVPSTHAAGVTHFDTTSIPMSVLPQGRVTPSKSSLMLSPGSRVSTSFRGTLKAVASLGISQVGPKTSLRFVLTNQDDSRLTIQLHPTTKLNQYNLKLTKTTNINKFRTNLPSPRPVRPYTRKEQNNATGTSQFTESFENGVYRTTDYSKGRLESQAYGFDRSQITNALDSKFQAIVVLKKSQKDRCPVVERVDSNANTALVLTPVEYGYSGLADAGLILRSLKDRIFIAEVIAHGAAATDGKLFTDDEILGILTTNSLVKISPDLPQAYQQLTGFPKDEITVQFRSASSNTIEVTTLRLSKRSKVKRGITGTATLFPRLRKGDQLLGMFPNLLTTFQSFQGMDNQSLYRTLGKIPSGDSVFLRISRDKEQYPRLVRFQRNASDTRDAHLHEQTINLPNGLKGAWTIHLNHGLVQILQNGIVLSTTYHSPATHIDNRWAEPSGLDTSRLRSFSVGTDGGTANLLHMSINGQTDDREFTAYEHGLLQNTVTSFTGLEPTIFSGDTIFDMLSTTKDIFGEQHADTAKILNQIGNYQIARKDFDAARSNLTNALRIAEDQLGATHPVTNLYRSDLGHLLALFHDYDTALPHLLESKRQIRLLFDSRDYRTISLTNKLISAQFSAGLYDKAMHNTIDILTQNNINVGSPVEVTLNPDRIDGYKNLIDTLITLGDNSNDQSTAFWALDSAKVIASHLFGENSDQAWISFIKSGIATADIAEQRSIAASAANVFLKTFSYIDKPTPQSVETLRTTGRLLLIAFPDANYFPNPPENNKDLKGISASKIFAAALGQQRLLTNRYLATASDAEAVVATKTQNDIVRDYIRALWLERRANPNNAVEAYSVILENNLLATRIMQERRRMRVDTEQIQRLRRELQSIRSKLSTLTIQATLAVQGSRAPKFRDLTGQKEQLQRQINQLQSVDTKLLYQRPHRLNELVDLLPKNSALVDFIRVASISGNSTDDIVAFVVQKTDNIKVDWFQLGKASDIEQAIGMWRQTLFRWAGQRGLAVIPDQAVKGKLTISNADVDQAASRLRELIWSPIESRFMADTTTVLIIPNAGMANIAWPAIPGKTSGSYLLQQYRISTLPFFHALVNYQNKEIHHNNESLLLVGGIQFTIDNDAGEPDLKKQQWPFLGGTQQEVQAIQKLFPEPERVFLLQKHQASEVSIKEALSSHNYIHLATHGFFNDLQDGTADNSVISRNPLSLSGIVLAGVNNTNQLGAEFGDGYLTGEDIVDIPMDHATLVVLSACETGLGVAVQSEGTFGLQRALALAGAETIIASQWKVDDAATKTLMTEFYRNLWIRKLDKLDSLRNAQITMLDSYDTKNQSLTNRGLQIRPNGNSEASVSKLPPFFWAAFGLSGNWK